MAGVTTDSVVDVIHDKEFHFNHSRHSRHLDEEVTNIFADAGEAAGRMTKSDGSDESITRPDVNPGTSFQTKFQQPLPVNDVEGAVEIQRERHHHKA